VMAATRATQGQVFSFEPMPENFVLLQRNLRANGCRNAQPFCLGVLDQAGPVEFTIDSRSSGGHTIKNLKTSTEKITVQMTTLEAIIREHNIQKIDFLKVDCEGSEFPIFYQSNPHVFSIVRRLAMEYHIVCKQPEKGQRAQEFITHLESLGFRTVKHIDIPNAWEGLLFMERV
ncbi:MAG: FkbM family methyltransferase, partial [Planctomycetota bacterium]